MAAPLSWGRAPLGSPLGPKSRTLLAARLLVLLPSSVLGGAGHSSPPFARVPPCPVPADSQPGKVNRKRDSALSLRLGLSALARRLPRPRLPGPEASALVLPRSQEPAREEGEPGGSPGGCFSVFCVLTTVEYCSFRKGFMEIFYRLSIFSKVVLKFSSRVGVQSEGTKESTVLEADKLGVCDTC